VFTAFRGLIDLSSNFRDLLIELADAGADFILVGGYAVAFHGHQRTTKGIDIFVRPTRENASKVFAGLRSFGAPLTRLDVSENDLASYDGVVQFGAPPNRIDILTNVSGITFDEALPGSMSFDLDGRKITVISYDALLKNKRAAGRDQDITDVKALERLRK
jgi:predicted nucleotidyltransferase